MGDITDNFLPPCSRSQTVPNMLTLTTEGDEREVTTPDSLLSDSKEVTDPRHSGLGSPVNVSKTPDSALSSANARKSGRIRLEFSSQFSNIILLYYFCSGLAWQSSEQTEDPNLAWTGMMETENEAVRDRLGDLERKVHRQNDEIVCLKATLADCLRRLNSLEVDKVRYHVPNALFDIFVVPT